MNKTVKAFLLDKLDKAQQVLQEPEPETEPKKPRISRATNAESAIRVEEVVELLSKRTKRSDIIGICTSKWGVGHEAVAKYIERANKLIVKNHMEKANEIVEDNKNLILNSLHAHAVGLPFGVEGADPRVQLEAIGKLIKIFGLEKITPGKQDELLSILSELVKSPEKEPPRG